MTGQQAEAAAANASIELHETAGVAHHNTAGAGVYNGAPTPVDEIPYDEGEIDDPPDNDDDEDEVIHTTDTTVTIDPPIHDLTGEHATNEEETTSEITDDGTQDAPTEANADETGEDEAETATGPEIRIHNHPTRSKKKPNRYVPTLDGNRYAETEG